MVMLDKFEYQRFRIVSWTTPSTASSSTFVDLTTDQNIAGNKIFEKDVVINAAVGRGKFNENSNTAIGLGALENNEGYANTAIGRSFSFKCSKWWQYGTWLCSIS
jgi:hypothetical protein